MIDDSKQMKIDEIDEKILNILLKDSKKSFREIAQSVGISAATVMNRINQLRNGGVIKKYTISLDYEKIDYDVQVIIEVKISKGKLHEVEKKVALNKNVFSIYDHTGATDATIIAKFKNRRLMNDFLKKLQTFDFVERTETKLILETIREGEFSI